MSKLLMENMNQTGIFRGKWVRGIQVKKPFHGRSTSFIFFVSEHNIYIYINTSELFNLPFT